MPTGYTLNLYEGKEETFSEFVMKCARAFGALIAMRDEPLSALIPEEFEPSGYNLEELEKAQRQLAEIKSWDNARADAEAEKAYQEELQFEKNYIAQKTELRQRYESMLAQVKAWTPPTSDHKELKQFMIQQLESSIDFDCKYTPEEPTCLSGTEYKQLKIKEAERVVKYHTKEHESEVKRAKERTEWTRALRESLQKTKSQSKK